MGTFFKALEQAERERSLKEQAKRRAVAGGDTASVGTRPPAIEPVVRPIVEPPAAPPTVFQRQKEQKEPEAPPKRSSTREDSRASLPRVDSHLVSLLAPNSLGAEQYRALELRVENLHKSSNLSIVAVTSPRPGDGKTLTTINLAGALALAPETRVLLVDADLRQSSMARRLGLENGRSRGLVGALLEPNLPLKDFVESCPPFNFSILRAGRRPSAPYELLKSSRLGHLFEEARRHYDYVIVDMPPLLPLPDHGVIARWVDGFLVVVSANKTPRKMVEEALKVLDPPTVIGLVFNGADRPYSEYYRGNVDRADRGRWWGRRGRQNDGAE